MWNVGVVMGKLSPRDSCLGHTLCVGFGVHSIATVCTVNASGSAVLNLTHQF